MLYCNKKSMTCDIDGIARDVIAEFSILTAQLHELLSEEYGEDEANEMIAKAGKVALDAKRFANDMLNDMMNGKEV